jgi:hypothetical protein
VVVVVRVAVQEGPHHVAVVARALVWVGEGGVGLADVHEAGGGGWVRGVVVWVVALGEAVEGLFDFGGGGVGVEVEGVVVVGGVVGGGGRGVGFRAEGTWGGVEGAAVVRVVEPWCWW